MFNGRFSVLFALKIKTFQAYFLENLLTVTNENTVPKIGFTASFSFQKAKIDDYIGLNYLAVFPLEKPQ